MSSTSSSMASRTSTGPPAPGPDIQTISAQAAGAHVVRRSPGRRRGAARIRRRHRSAATPIAHRLVEVDEPTGRRRRAPPDLGLDGLGQQRRRRGRAGRSRCAGSTITSTRAELALRQRERPQHVVGHDAAGVADDVRLAQPEAEERRTGRCGRPCSMTTAVGPGAPRRRMPAPAVHVRRTCPRSGRVGVENLVDVRGRAGAGGGLGRRRKRTSLARCQAPARPTQARTAAQTRR